MKPIPAGSKVSGRSLRVFIRQPFTQTGNREQAVIQGVVDLLRNLDGQPHRLHLLTGERAESSQTFGGRFEIDRGLSFTPQTFRAVRLGLLDQADALVVIKTGLSESGAFELAYNIFGGRRAPVFFAIWKEASLETTLLQDLGELVPTRYVTFAEPSELREPLLEFLERCAGSLTTDSVNGIREKVVNVLSEAERRPLDTRSCTGEYRYGFPVDALFEPCVDEGGESG
jgi:carbamoyl-phosphate synthase large subunit